MRQNPFGLLALAATLALAACGDLATTAKLLGAASGTPAPKTGADTKPVAAETTAPPTSDILAPVVPKEGAASQTYVLGTQELQKRGYKTWDLVKVSGQNMSNAGVMIKDAPGLGSQWVVTFKSTDGKFFTATRFYEGGNPKFELVEDKEGDARAIIPQAQWKIDSREAVKASGFSGTSIDYMEMLRAEIVNASFKATQPVWQIDKRPNSYFAGAETGLAFPAYMGPKE